MRICLVKQANCYDLYTTLATDVGVLAKSSNCRSGPLALWEFPGAEVEFRIVEDSPDPECRVGEQRWANWVVGWDYKRWEGHRDPADSVDWDAYDIVICVDVAVPERVVRLYRHTLWCYLFVEGGPERRAPQYSYNVFLNHLPATRLLTATSVQSLRMAASRRATLDFPYYLHSDTTLARIYAPGSLGQRSGTCIYSKDYVSPQRTRMLEQYGELRLSSDKLPAELHSAMAASKYFVMLPGSAPRAGGVLVEAISAGCVVLAPRASVVLRSMLLPELDFSSDDDLVRCLDAMETDPATYRRARIRQAETVRLQFCEYPLQNLAHLWRAFRASDASASAQRRAERLDAAAAPYWRLAHRARLRLRRATGPDFHH